MIRRIGLIIILLVGIAATMPVSAASDCKNIVYKSLPYTVCTVDISDDLRLWYSNDQGEGYGSFRAINASLAAQDQMLAFAMNAGMYHADRTPVGLYIEDGKTVTALADGGTYGNFGLKPNGVFCITTDAFQVIETNAFRANPPACTYATQSGPMLVIDGALHPRFLADSTSKYVRNGVGVSANGKTAYLVISNKRVTFHQFGSLFRDHLKTPNALYFDGKVSRLHAPNLNRSGAGFSPLGAMIGKVISKP